jgi:putative membrane protein
LAPLKHVPAADAAPAKSRYKAGSFGGITVIMLAAWNSVVAGLPVLLVQLAATTGLFVVGLAIYIWLTPYRELKLIRDGNVAAAITLSGQMLALAIPLGGMLAHSVSLADILLWGIVAVLLQLIAFAAAAILLRDLPKAIERGDIGPALVLATAQIVAGIFNAAAMSG